MVRADTVMKRGEDRQSYESLVASLRRARLEAGLTQAEAAKRLGRSQSYISKCESGERRVDFVELVEFARAYGKSMSFFQSAVEGEE